MDDPEALDAWFVREVLPLEAALMRFLRRKWRVEGDILDLRQELYVRVYEAVGRQGMPAQTKPFVFTAARNLVIDHVRRARVVSIEIVADLEASHVAVDAVTPDRHVTARDELRRLQAGLDRLPARCREVVMLRKIEGLSQREVAARMGIAENTVERQMMHGMRALADFMLNGSGKIRRSGSRSARQKARLP